MAGMQNLAFVVQSQQPWQATGVTIPPGVAVTIAYQNSLWTADPESHRSNLYHANGCPNVIVPMDQNSYPITGVRMGALVGRVAGGTPLHVVNRPKEQTMGSSLSATDSVTPLTEAERRLVEHIDRTWTRERALFELKSHLQVAIEVELATIPIYLYTYYSIDRTPGGFPDSPISRFADKAGAVIMSVAVEEMLHMSLSSNVLFALGQQPQLYRHSPSPYPTNLPGHALLGPDAKPLSLPLAKLSLEQLWHFLEIEYPAPSDAPPEAGHWKTIGQIYSFVRCIISSTHISDDDFHQGERKRQIQPTNYSPNSIDTVFPGRAFNNQCPVAAPVQNSAAHVADFSNREDSHAGPAQLLTIDSRKAALQAIQTIDAQGEGSGLNKFDDPSRRELSHYYKFLTLQSQLQGYDPCSERLAHQPKPPAPAARQYSADELRAVVFDFPDNPVAAAYPAGRREVADLVSGLYQYMLIMTESIFLQEPARQKLYFNQSLHRSMIWILDKIVQAMRAVYLDGNSKDTSSLRLAPTFENIDLGPRQQAFSTLVAMCKDLNLHYAMPPGTPPICSTTSTGCPPCRMSVHSGRRLRTPGAMSASTRASPSSRQARLRPSAAMKCGMPAWASTSAKARAARATTRVPGRAIARRRWHTTTQIRPVRRCPITPAMSITRARGREGAACTARPMSRTILLPMTARASAPAPRRSTPNVSAPMARTVARVSGFAPGKSLPRTPGPSCARRIHRCRRIHLQWRRPTCSGTVRPSSGSRATAALA